MSKLAGALPLKVTPTQARVLQALEEAGGAVLEEALLEQAKVGVSVLGTLERNGLVERVRRLVRRGDALMRGGYRQLAQIDAPEKGRFALDAKRP